MIATTTFYKTLELLIMQLLILSIYSYVKMISAVNENNDDTENYTFCNI